jgi:hypothetical protein
MYAVASYASSMPDWDAGGAGCRAKHRWRREKCWFFSNAGAVVTFEESARDSQFHPPAPSSMMHANCANDQLRIEFDFKNDTQ